MKYLIKAQSDEGFVVACVLKYKTKPLYSSIKLARGRFTSLFRKHKLLASAKSATQTYVVWNGQDLDLHNHVPTQLQVWWFEIQRGQEYTYKEMFDIMRWAPDADFVANQLVRLR